MADDLMNVQDSCFHCCSKCKGLFNTSEDHLKHHLVCNGNPFKSSSLHFACERKIYLQLFQTEDFQTDGSFSQLNISKDDSFIDHVVKIRMPQDLADPSIFLRTNTSSNLQIPLFDPSNIEAEVNKNDDYLQENKSRFLETIEQDQLRKIINKNIDYLKSDDITALTSQTNKELSFPQSQSEPRLLSPIEKHFLPDGPKSRVQSPFEKCINYLQETGSGFQTGSLTFASNQSIPFSCNLTTDLLGGLAAPADENLTSVDELPTLQYLDLAKKDLFFGQNPGLNQVNTKDPFLINATVKTDRPVSAGPRYPTQSSKSCEDLTSPTFPLQDANYFNFPSTLDEPTQLDYLDLATLDLLTNPNSFGYYGAGMFRDKFADDREDIYSECNFLFHEQNLYANDNVEKSEKQTLEENIKLKKSKMKRISLKKAKRGMVKKNKASNNKKNNAEPSYEQKSDAEVKLSVEALTDSSLAGRPPPDKKRFKRTYSAEYADQKPSTVSRKRKLMSCTDTLSFRISPEAKRKAPKVDRKFNESQRLCPTNAILNVKDTLVGFSEEEKKSMTAVLGQSGCIIVKKQKSSGRTELRPEQIITEVSTNPVENQLFVLEGSTLHSYEDPAVTNAIQVPLVNPPSSSGSSTDNVKSVLKLKCQICCYKTTNVKEFQEHRNKHDTQSDTNEHTEETTGEEKARDISRPAVDISHFVSNTTNDIETLENCVFSDEPVFYNESANNIQIAADRIVDRNESINLSRSGNRVCPRETILDICDQIYDDEDMDNSQIENFQPQSGQCISDQFDSTGTINQDIGPHRNEFQELLNGTIDVLHSHTALSTSIPAEVTQPTTDSTAQMTLSSDGMFYTSDNAIQPKDTNNYNADASPPAQTSECTELEAKCQLSEMMATVNETTKLSLAVSNTSYDIVDNDRLPGSIPIQCDGDLDILADTPTQECPPDNEKTAPEDPLTNTGPEPDEENQEENPVVAFEEEPKVASENNLKMVSEETQTVHSYFIQNPPTIYIFGKPKSPDKNNDEKSKTNQIDKGEVMIDDDDTSFTDIGMNTDGHDEAVEQREEMCNISDDTCDTKHVSVGVNSEQDIVEAAVIDSVASDVSNLSHTSEVPFTAVNITLDKGLNKEPSTNDEHETVTGQVDNKELPSSVDICKALDGRNEDVHVDCSAKASRERNVGLTGVETSIKTEAEKVCTVSRVKETAVRSEPTVHQSTLSAVRSEPTLPQSTLSAVRSTPTLSRRTLSAPVTVVDLDHCYTRATDCKLAGQPSAPSTSQPSTSPNTDKPVETFYTCEDCGFRTTRKNTMKAHTVKHEGVQLSCSAPGCDFTTVHKRCLNFHLLKHNSEYKLLCDQCAFTTTDSKSLRRHMQVKHYHHYRYKCPDCDQLSMFRERIANHVRHAHLQEKLYACNQCNYRTGYTHLLKFHLMAHAGIRPYKCSVCDYQVNNANKVTRHIKTRHKGQPGIVCEKLDLNFEVDAKQFQCETKTCDKDINVIELTDEQVAEIVEKRLAKQEKCLQEKLREIPVFDPKTMQPKKMVSLLQKKVTSPEKQTEQPSPTSSQTSCSSNISFIQVPFSQTSVAPNNSNLKKIIVKRKSLDDSFLVRTKPGYKGMENIWTSIKTPNRAASTGTLIRDRTELGTPAETMIKYQSELGTSTEAVIKDVTPPRQTAKELDCEYKCSMCDFKLKSHEDISKHLLVCKMERNKSI